MYIYFPNALYICNDRNKESEGGTNPQPPPLPALHEFINFIKKI